MTNVSNLIVAVPLIIAVLLVWFLLRLLKKPIKWAFKLLIHAVFGFVYLFLFNLFGSKIGLTIDITWLNAIISGVLGIPGVILLLILRFLR